MDNSTANERWVIDDFKITVSSPSITLATSGSRCGSGAVVLNATASGTINWYASSTWGNSLKTGNSFTTPSLSTTTVYYVDATSGSFTSSPRVAVTASIITPPTISASGGGSYCTGSTLNLTSTGTGITNQYWTGPNSFYSLSPNPSIAGATAAINGTYTVIGSALSGTNLVSNGDFEAGNTGFVSAYINSSDLTPEGTYAVVANPYSVHSGYTNCVDHTPAGTLQMVVNGAITGGVNVWSQSVNVVAGTDYQFTYWVQSVVASNPSQLQLLVNDVGAGPTYTADTPTCSWKKFIYNWNSGSSTTALLSLVNKNQETGGNDFALDDIEFKQACTASAIVNVTVASSFAPAVSISATSNSICEGTSVIFTATPTNGGATPSYQWKKGSTNVGTNSPTYTTSSLTSGDKVTCVLKSSFSCASPETATSNLILMTVNPNLPASVSIAASSNPVCAGTSVTFTATPTNGGGSPVYQWKLNSTNVGTNSSTYTNSTLADGNTVTCVLTSNATCATGSPATSNTVTMSVNATSILGMASNVGPINFCSASGDWSSVPISVSGAIGTVTWQWGKSNGGWSGDWAIGTSPIYTYFPKKTSILDGNADRIRYYVKNGACSSTGFSPVILIQNRYNEAPTSLTLSSGSVCSGTAITLTANFPTNINILGSVEFFSGSCGGTLIASVTAGDNVNSVSTSVTPPLGSTTYYARYNPGTGSLCSASTCVNATVTVNPNLPVGISIAASSNPVCAGTSVTFTATPTNGGTAPVYQWKKNGVNAGTNSPTYSYAPANNDAITCLLTSNAPCATGSPATSNALTMVVNPLSVAPTSISGTTAICVGGSTILTAEGGLVAYYPFTSDVNDHSGNNLNLTGSGGSFSGGGIQLSSSAVYSSVPTTVLNTDKYTISFDMKYTSAPNNKWCKIFGYTPSGTDRSPGIWRYPDKMQLHWRHDPLNTGLVESYIYTITQWYHIVGEKNGSTFTLYVDGVQVDQGTVANPKASGIAPLVFGHAEIYDGADVILKEFKIYNSNLRWYTASCGGALIGAGPSITVSPITTTTYYVGSEGTCNTTSCASKIVTVTPTVGTPSTPSPSASTICQGSANTSYTTSATNATSYNWSVTGTGNTISGTGTTGTVTWAAGFSGSATVSVTATGCGTSASASTTVIVTPTVTINAFSPATSTRCQGAGMVTTTTTANNSTGITYNLDAATAAFTGNSINSGTGEVTYAAGWTGMTTITASAAGCNGPATATHVVTITAQPTAPTLSTKSPNLTNLCLGDGVSATFNAGSGGTGCSDDYTVSIDGATAVVYTPGTTVGTTATSSIVIQGRRAGCTGGAGCTGTSYVTLASWTVYPIFNSGTILTTGETICYNGNPGLIGSSADASGGNGSFTYKWKANGVDIASSNSETYDPPTGITANTTYTRWAKDGKCTSFTQSTGSWIVTVNSLIGNNSIDFTNGTHGTICAAVGENGNAALTAPSGTVFIKVDFASYGTPDGSCPDFTLGSCNASASQLIAEGSLLGNNSASIPATNAVFEDPCVGTFKRFYVSATYTEPICKGVAPGTITGSLPTGGNGTYTYLWESSTTSASLGFTPAAMPNNEKEYTPAALAQTTWYRRTVTSGGCSDVGTVLQLTLDNIKPVISNCPSDMTPDIDDNLCSAVVTWAIPTITDNCGEPLSLEVASNVLEEIKEPTPGFHRATIAVGTSIITYTATDAAGNKSYCSFNITVEDLTAPDITTSPTDQTVFCASNIPVINTIDLFTTAGGVYTDNAYSAGGTCGAVSVAYSDDSSVAGQVTRTYTLTDGGGRFDTCTQVFTILKPSSVSITSTDMTNTCEGSQLDISTTSTGPFYQWEVSSDNSSFSPIPSANSSSYSGLLANKGDWYRLLISETIDFSASDCYVESNHLQFGDYEAPTWVTSAGTEFFNRLTNTAGSYSYSICSVTSTTIPALAIGSMDVLDNCTLDFDDLTIEYTINSGARVSGDASNYLFPVATTTVDYFITDLQDNELHQQFTVTVEQAPGPVTITFDTDGDVPSQCGSYTYQVDGGTTDPLFTYSWNVYTGSAVIGSPILTSSSSSASFQITWTGDMAPGTYTIEATKKSGNGCESKATLEIELQNSFNLTVNDPGEDCKGESIGTKSFNWKISRSCGSNDYSFTYRIAFGAVSYTDRATVPVGDFIGASVDITSTDAADFIINQVVNYANLNDGNGFDFYTTQVFTLFIYNQQDENGQTDINAGDDYQHFYLKGTPNTSEITTD